MSETLIDFMKSFRNRIFYFMTRYPGEKETKSYDLLGELKEMMTDTIKAFGGDSMPEMTQEKLSKALNDRPSEMLGDKQLKKELRQWFKLITKPGDTETLLSDCMTIISPYLKRESGEEKKEVPPVDISAQQLVSGAPVPEDRSHTKLKDNGQQRDYIVLTSEERAKGFVRPVRHSYIHKVCGSDTRMSREIAETYAREPKFYNGTFCCECKKHFPLDQFVWKDAPNEQVGS